MTALLFRLFSSTTSLALLACLALQGCAAPPLFYATPVQARQYTLEMAGQTAPPAGALKVPGYFSKFELWRTWVGTWTCNNDILRVRVAALSIDKVNGNEFSGKYEVLGDCDKRSSDRIAGRFNGQHLYLYWVDNPTTALFRYVIEKSGVLTFDREYKLQEGQLRYILAGSTYQDWVTNRSFRDGPADDYRRFEWRPRVEAPSLEADLAETRAAWLPDAIEQAQAAGNKLAADRARASEEAADQRRQDLAALQARFAQTAQAPAQPKQNNIFTESQRAADAQRAEVARRNTTVAAADAAKAKSAQDAQRQQQEAARQQAAQAESQRQQAQRDQEAVKKKQQAEREAADQAARKVQEQAAQKAAEKAQKDAEAKEKREYLDRMRREIRLAARNCYGSTEVGGKRPGGKEVVSCIDVSFTAYCPGESVGTKGTLKNFIDFDAGCFGDTSSIPKTACKASELRVKVDEVRECGQ